MSKATDDTLSDLHGQLAQVMKDMLNDPEKVTPSIIKEVRAFLVDNKIEAIPVKGSIISDLVDALPDLDDSDPAFH